MEETAADAPLLMHCPECGQALDVAGVGPYAKIECPHCSVPIRARTAMGQYEIVGILGEGGMSQVFRALDRNLGREVALKILHQSLGRDEALVAMFEREAKLTASIVHPNVVKVFTVGRDQGYFFIAMELLQAVSLERLIATKGALSESEALGIALDVSRGLKAAYDERLIHRDIKPGNMLVTGDGTTKLVDFGLALHQDGEDLSEELWATPFYVPPEKLEGDPDTFLGDIYSLGATLYHALAGKPPFDANTPSMEELKSIKKQPVDLKSAAPGLSKATVKLVETMMAYRPGDRVPSYDSLIAQIEEVRKRRFGIEAVPRAQAKRRRGAMVAVGLGILLLVALALPFFLDGKNVVEEGGMAIGQDERVITASESNVAERFVEGREHFAAGRFGKAREIFGKLVAEETAPASTRIWSRFFLGSIQLFSGDLEAASASFRQVLELTPESGAETAEAIAFLKRAAAALSDPLPLLPEEATFSPDSIESLGLLAAGLKNWQHGEFASGAALLRAFAESRPPAESPWLESLKSQTGPFLADFETLASLPNPAASFTEAELAAAEEALSRGTEALRTRGAAPRLVKGRLGRIGQIRELAAKASAEAAATAEGAATPSEGAEPSPDEQAEAERLRAAVVALQPFSEALRFPEAAEQIQSESLATPLGAALREELVHGYGQAARYLGLLAGRLRTAPYQGIVRRRAGRSFEAEVSAVDAMLFVVDLGFGPNEIEVEEFAPDWLVEVGAGVLPPLSARTAEEWEALVFFGLFTGGADAVSAKAGELGAVDETFARRWERLQRLR